MSRALLLGLLVLASAAQAQTTLVYDDVPLRDVIEDVEARTDWRFLYRDALVAGARVRLTASSSTVPDALAQVLAPQGISVDADPSRRQILLASAPRRSVSPTVASAPPAPEATRRVRGRVVDAETGEPLPFATVTWDGGRLGTVCDSEGGFSLELRGDAARQRTTLTASFAGYETSSSAPAGEAVTFRLQSPALSPSAIVIAAPLLDTVLDDDWATVVQRGAGIGEGGGLRALEALPSVAPSALFSDGTVVRGSAPDAFEVRLDGVPIYNPRHLFGLADAFNLDALRAVALHYGVPPARSAAPPGGSLEYVTSAGSMRQARVQAGVSSLGVRATVEGPLRPGRTSALLAARLSTLGTVPWSVGEDLVALGLGAETRTSPLPQNTLDAFDLATRVTGTSAAFGDLHLALADEGAQGRRTTVTVYLGGDRTSLDALRRKREVFGDEDSPIVQIPVETHNRWGSGAIGIGDRRTLGASVTLSSQVGLSAYDARFETDDYSYRRTRNPLEMIVDTLQYANTLREVVWSEQVDTMLGAGVLTLGADAHLYRVAYEELARRVRDSRQVFERSQAEQRVDLHAAWAGPLGGRLRADVGGRAHLYSADRQVRVSPRLRLTAVLGPSVSVSAGFGRSHQFVHRLTLGDAPAAAAWVLSAESEPPTESDHLEGAISAQLGRASVHVAVYGKQTRNLREHTESRTSRRLRETAVLALPWLPDVEAQSRGLETMMRLPAGPVALGAVYALTRTDLEHLDLNDGDPFRADWDRRHRLTLSADASPGYGLAIGVAWTWASGAPNPLEVINGTSLGDFFPQEAELSAIQRLDVRIAHSQRMGPTRLTATLAVRNVLGSDNVTVREFTSLLQTRDGDRRFLPFPLDVYDVGRLPTFDLAIGF